MVYPDFIISISSRANLSKNELCWLCGKWDKLDEFYTSFEIAKKSGAKRSITAPNATLKKVQNKILKGILQNIEVNPSCHGFRKNRSTITNASLHINKEVIVNIDLEDFFPSISAARVYGIFLSIGCETLESRFLTRLTTTNSGNCLPQGAPTSPALANLACRRLDSRLAGLAKKLGANYTRYADDLTFSGNDNIITAIPFIKKIIKEEGFNVNKIKFRIVRKGNRQEVTGLTVNNKISVPRKYRKLIRSICHRLIQGKEIKWNGFRMEVNSLKGHLAYLKQLHQELVNKIINKISILN